MITDPKEITAILQAEYDFYYDKYRRGCSYCLGTARAIRDVAHKLGVEIDEHEKLQWNENTTVTGPGAR